MADIRINSLPTTASASSSNDFLAIDGATNGTRKLSAYSPTFGGNLTVSGSSGITATDVILGSSGPSVKSTLSARAPRQGLVFDGTGTATLTFATGAGDFSFAWRQTLSALPASYGYIVKGASNGFSIFINAGTGSIAIEKSGTGPDISTGVNATVGTTDEFVYVRTIANTGTEGKLYRNGVLVATVADARDYSGATSYFGGNVSSNRLTGTFGVLAYNRALSAAEVVALYEAGTPNAISTSGLLLAPDAGQAGGGLTWYDTSGNAANITLPASGVTWNVPSSQKTASGWTYGGNLTVSGTGTSSFAGRVNFNGASGVGLPNNTIIGFAKSDGTANNWQIYCDTSNGLSFVNTGYAGVAIRMVDTTGNLLLGTTTDSGNGKLQLASSTATSGGLGFGTDVSLYRSAAGTLALMDYTSAATGVGGVLNLQGFTSGTSGLNNFAIIKGTKASGTVGGNFIVQTSDTSGNPQTALTLDSSQNATFAKALTVNGPSNASATASLQFGSADNAVIATVNSMIFQVDSTGSVAGRTYEWKKGAAGYSGGTSLMTLDNSGNATFAGSVTATTSSASGVESGFSNTAVNTAAYSLFSIKTASGGGDPYLLFYNVGVEAWSIGMDVSDSNSWKLSRSTSVGSNDRLTITTAGDATFAGNLIRNGAAATDRGIQFATSSITRWFLYEDNVAESGSNAGSNLRLASYTDGGGYLSQIFEITRSTGLTTFNGQVALTTSTPASASATGVAGTITWDSSYIYVCTATNTWKRVAIATW